ncbi:NAD-dependent epimerase/dehydratase family protein [Salinarimonas ramus]|uniref:CDP-4-dehydro-6-deoxy-D-gulose 4-reductase n=1 Tax=Salinarimonas ramus TaxID=690164 RepID=A0A917V3C5_9HYPH|nr:NAD-dependent epimerase/dehydratase family protein [Salinarimonas ramus]GGK29284.1 CDP-4-dehydro-6-deoxy-D-gulose 4-reductase [Salinarimonas ramus]
MSARGTLLLTGATGFIGRPLAARLAARGWRVVGTTARAVPAEVPGIAAMERADLTDAASARALIARVRPNALVHAAWTTTPGRFWADPANLAWLEGGIALLDAFGAAGGERAVGLGTCAEYEAGAERLDEATTPLRPATLYGAAKAALFHAGTAAAMAHGVSFAWARVFTPYGADEPEGKLVGSVARALLAGRPVETTQGTQLRDFLHVEDVAEAIAALVDGGVEGPVNVGSGEAVSLRDVIARISALTGGGERVAFGARPRPPHDPDSMVAAVERLTREVGFRPAIPLDEGLARTIAALASRMRHEQTEPEEARP